MSTEALAKRLHEARVKREEVEIPTDLWPTNEDMVIGAQEEVLRLGGLTPGGWKAGPPPLGLSAQVGAARLPAEWTKESPAKVVAPNEPFYVEAEFVVRLGRDLPAADAPYDRDAVAAAADAVAPGIELVWRRIADRVAKDTGILHMADSGGHTAFVLGEWRENWQSLDLTKHPVRLLINGKEIKAGHSG
ncbi:MAG TPA: hypothetical protein VKA18_00120, partial [Alphaproteobacteria bacterium]|nr:hypothetical protein [Alphaproteobacteria bacterium]